MGLASPERPAILAESGSFRAFPADDPPGPNDISAELALFRASTRLQHRGDLLESTNPFINGLRLLLIPNQKKAPAYHARTRHRTESKMPDRLQQSGSIDAGIIRHGVPSRARSPRLSVHRIAKEAHSMVRRRGLARNSIILPEFLGRWSQRENDPRSDRPDFVAPTLRKRKNRWSPPRLGPSGVAE